MEHGADPVLVAEEPVEFEVEVQVAEEQTSATQNWVENSASDYEPPVQIVGTEHNSQRFVPIESDDEADNPPRTS